MTSRATPVLDSLPPGICYVEETTPTHLPAWFTHFYFRSLLRVAKEMAN